MCDRAICDCSSGANSGYEAPDKRTITAKLITRWEMSAQQSRIVLTVTDAEPVFESVAVIQGSCYASFLLLPVAELCIFDSLSTLT
jgi:hypothetical protein